MSKSSNWMKWIIGTLWCVPGFIVAKLYLLPVMRLPNRYTFSGCMQEPSSYALVLDAVTYWFARGVSIAAMFTVMLALSYGCIYAATHMAKDLFKSTRRFRHWLMNPSVPKCDMSNNYKQSGSDIAVAYELTPMSRRECFVDFINRVLYAVVTKEWCCIALIVFSLIVSTLSYVLFTMPMICQTAASIAQMLVTNLLIAIAFPTIPVIVACVKFDGSNLQTQLKERLLSKVFHIEPLVYEWFDDKDWHVAGAGRNAYSPIPNKTLRLEHQTLDRFVYVLIYDNSIVVQGRKRFVIMLPFDWKLLRREDVYAVGLHFAETRLAESKPEM